MVKKHLKKLGAAAVCAVVFALCPQTLLGATADTFADLVLELNAAIAAGGAHTIDITNMDETHWTSVATPNQIDKTVQITLVSHRPMTITTDPGLRHFTFIIIGVGNLTFKLENITLDGGGDGGGIHIDATGTLEFAGGTITNCKNTSGGAIYSAGSVIINGGTISGNTASQTGGGVYADDTVSVSQNAKVNGNTAAQNGGGVYGNTATINGGTISDNTAETGGGVYADDTASVSQNAKVTGNTAAQNGGGVYANTATINGGTISDNTAETGGGVYADDTASVSQNAKVNSNTAVYGGGVYALSQVTINGGVISDNTASQTGGGVYAFWGNVDMSDGVISGNTAVAGGGGAINALLEADISGGIISGNTAATVGGGIFCAYAAISGGTISGNTAAEGGGIYFNYNINNPICLTSTAVRFSANLALSGGYDINLSAFPTHFLTWTAETVTAPYTHIVNNHDVGFYNFNNTSGLDGPYHVLSFMKNDSTATELARIAPEDASELFPRDPSWGAYEFMGWNRSQQGAGEWVKRTTNFPVNQSARIYARWQEPYVPKEYDPSLYGYYSPYDEPIPDHSDPHKGGTLAYTVYQVKLDTSIDSTGKIPEIIVRVKAGDILKEPKAPAKAGYNFTGWFTDIERTKPYDFDKKVKKSFTLYGGWEAVE